MGDVSFDDITLYPPRCLYADRPVGDLAGEGLANYDCKVDYKDVAVISDEWLSQQTKMVLWYKFDEPNDGNIVVHDSSGNGYDGTINSDSNLLSIHGKIDGCVNFSNYGDAIEVPLEVLSSIEDEITIAFWANGNPNDPFPSIPTDEHPKDHDCMIHAKYSEDMQGKVLGIYLPEPNSESSGVAWYATNPDYYALEDRIDTKTLKNIHYRGSWNHWAFTKNVNTGEMAIYYNGEPNVVANNKYQKIYGAAQFAEGQTGLRVGCKVKESQYGRWYVFGRVDDFRIYNFALPDADIEKLYNLQEPLPRPDLNLSGRVNFNDFALLGNSWLEEKLFP